MNLRILVVGAGAVGGYFGARLSQAGRDVTFLVRPGRASQIRSDGLRIISPHGDAVLNPKLVGAGDLYAPFDLVFLSVKAFALDAAMDDCVSAVGPQTMILPVLNGMRHIGLLIRRFGETAVIGGVCRVAAEIDAAGRIVQIADIQQLAYGERSGQATARTAALDATLQGAGFEARLASDITHAMWEKWVQIASLGAITCLARGSIGDIVGVPSGADLAGAILKECAAITTACGHKPSETFLEQNSRALTTARSPLTSSMYRDLCKGAPVEVDHILGDLLERGREHAVITPLLQAASVNLRVYQGTRHAFAEHDARRSQVQRGNSP
jgi:2-dehydropantoate 2-reductase